MSDIDPSIHEDVEAFALGALDEPERTAFELHLSACEACRVAYASYAPVLASLRSVDAVTAPHVPSLYRTRRSALAGLAAAAVLALGIGVGSIYQQHQLADDAAIVRMVADEPTQVALRGNGASGRVIVGHNRARTAFVIYGLPAPPPGHAYQVWLRGKATSSPGLLHTASDGIQLLVVAGNLLEGVKRIGVSLEPAGGSQQRTTPPVLTGEV